ncbi:MAG: MFS transporter [Polyangiaceae bacterium]
MMGEVRQEVTDGLPNPQRFFAVIAIAIAITITITITMAVLDAAIVNVALPVIGHDLKVSQAESVWVVNAYQLAITISLLPLASLGDIVGYKRVYWSGLCGVGFGLFQSPNNRVIMGSAPRARSGGASGLQSVGRVLGQSLGVVAVATAFGLAHNRYSPYLMGCAAALGFIGACTSALRRNTNPRVAF